MATDNTSLRINIDSTSAKTAQNDLDGLTSSSKKAEGSANQASSAFSVLSKVLATIGAGALAKEFIKTADAIQLLNARLRLVTSSTEEYKKQQIELLKISKDTFSSYEDTVTLYTKLDPSLKRLGATTDGVNEVVDSFSKGLKLGGASAAESSAAILQFAQAMGSGVLRGDEFNSMMEASPKLMQYIAKGMDVPVTALRSMAEQGQLSAGKVSTALLKMSDDIDRDFKTLPQTVGNSLTNLKTDISLMVDEVNTATQFTQSLAKIIDEVGNSADGSTESFIKVGSAISQTTTDVIAISKEFGTLLSSINDLTSDGAGITLFEAAITGLRVALDTIYVGLYNAIVIAKELVSAGKNLFTDKDINLLNNINNKILTLDDLTNRYSVSLSQSTQKKVADNKEIEKTVFNKDAEIKKIQEVSSKIDAESKAKKNAKKTQDNLNKAIEKQNELNEKLDREYLKITGNEYENYLQSVNDKMVELAKSTTLTSEELKKARDIMMMDAPVAKEQGPSTDGYYSAIESANELIKEQADVINEKYLDIYNLMDGIWNDEQMSKFFDKWNEQLETVNKTADKYEGVGSADWVAGLKGQNKAIANVGNAFKDIAKDQENWNKLSDEDKDIEENKNKHLTSQIDTYSNLAGAMSSMYEEGSSAAQAFTVVQQGLALVNAVTAVAGAWASAPFPANIPGVLATSAAVAALLGSIGQSLVGSGTSNSYDAGAAQEANTGTGTVLGDSSKQSESIANSVSILKDFAKPQYQVLMDMNDSLSFIAANIGGLAAQIIKTGGHMMGEGFTESKTSSPFERSDFTKATSVISDATTAILTGGISLLLGGGIGDFIGGAVSAIFGGSTKTSLYDYGLTFNEQLVTSAIEAIDGSAFQTIKTKTSGGWFGHDKTRYSTVLSTLDEQVQKDFTTIISGLYDTVISASSALDIAVSDTTNSLSQSVINLGKISFKDKTGEEIQTEFESIFSKVGDELAKTAFPMLDVYQKVGEAYFETMTRVATDVQVVTKTFDLFSNSIEDNKIAISESFVQIAGSLSDFQDLTSNYYDSYFTESEQYANTLDVLNKQFESLNITTPKTYEEFRKIVDGLDVTTLAGQEAFMQMMQLADSFTTIGDMAKKSVDNIKSFADSFKTQEELTQDMAKSLGVNVAASNNELLSLFETLKGGIDGLTDSELGFLNANKALLESNYELEKSNLNTSLDEITSKISSLESVLSSLTGIIDKLKGSAIGSSYTMAKYYDSMNKTLSLSGSDDIASFQSSLNDTISASSVLFDAANFTISRDQQFAQLVAANQFDTMKTASLTQIDYLKLIEINTREQIDAILSLITAVGKKIDDSLMTSENPLSSVSDSNVGAGGKTLDSIMASIPDNRNATAPVSLDSLLASGLDPRQLTSDKDYVFSAEQLAAFTPEVAKARAESDVIDAYARILGTTPTQNAIDVFSQRYLSGELESSADLYRTIAVEAIYNDYQSSNAQSYLDKVGLRGYAQGTPNMQDDMIAGYKKGEIVVPNTFSDGLRSGVLSMGNNNEQVELLRQQNSLLNGIITKLQEQLDTQNSSAESLEYIAKVS